MKSSPRYRARGYSRSTIHLYAQQLRVFFQFAEQQGWCTPGLAGGILAATTRSRRDDSEGIESQRGHPAACHHRGQPSIRHTCPRCRDAADHLRPTRRRGQRPSARRPGLGAGEVAGALSEARPHARVPTLSRRRADDSALSAQVRSTAVRILDNEPREARLPAVSGWTYAPISLALRLRPSRAPARLQGAACGCGACVGARFETCVCAHLPSSEPFVLAGVRRS